MTKQQLADRHFNIYMERGGQESSQHANLSIQYAIEILEHLLKKEKKENIFLHDIVVKKTEALKKIL